MFTPQPIGFVSSPYKQPGEVPRGLGAKHQADGMLKILPQFEAGLTDIEGFSHLMCFGSLTARRDFNCWAHRPLTIVCTVCLPRVPRTGPTLLA